MNRYVGICGHFVRQIRSSDTTIPVYDLPIKCSQCDPVITPEVIAYFIREHENRQHSIINKISPPQTMWIEDENGNLISDETEIMKNEPPPCFNEMEQDRPPSKRYANFRSAVVKHDVFGDKTEKNPSGLIFSGESTFNCCGKSIAKMVLEHRWNINDACVFFSISCEGCMNAVCAELEGWEYNENPSTCCDYCDTIRPGVNRPLTGKEERALISKTISSYGLKDYAQVIDSIKIPIVPQKRMIIKDTVTGFYRVIEKGILS